MRLGVIHMPLTDNDGADISTVHNALEMVLVNAFGGCTVLPGLGLWRDDNTGKIHNEPVVVYQVAAEPTAINSEKLRQIAIHYGVAADQLAVYVQDFFGEVQILNCDCRVPTEGIHP